MDEKACFPTAICGVSGRQVFDSRANPTVAARVRLRCGAVWGGNGALRRLHRGL